MRISLRARLSSKRAAKLSGSMGAGEDVVVEAEVEVVI
jgi:hypothetical protein